METSKWFKSGFYFWTGGMMRGTRTPLLYFPRTRPWMFTLSYICNLLILHFRNALYQVKFLYKFNLLTFYSLQKSFLLWGFEFDLILPILIASTFCHFNCHWDQSGLALRCHTFPLTLDPQVNCCPCPHPPQPLPTCPGTSQGHLLWDLSLCHCHPGVCLSSLFLFWHSWAAGVS